MDEAVRRISWIHFLRKIVLEGWSVLLKTWKMFVLTRVRSLNVHLWLRKGRSMLSCGRQLSQFCADRSCMCAVNSSQWKPDERVNWFLFAIELFLMKAGYCFFKPDEKCFLLLPSSFNDWTMNGAIDRTSLYSNRWRRLSTLATVSLTESIN